MQRIFRRVSWQNLSIQAKTGLLFLGLVILILIMAISAIITLNTVRAQINTVTADAVAMRTLARDIETGIEELELLYARVKDAAKSPGFDAQNSPLITQFNTEVNDLRANEIPRLRELALETRIREQVSEDLQASLFTLDVNVGTMADDFETSYNVFVDLHDPEEGALAQMDQHGDELQSIIEERRDGQLVAQLNVMRNFEQTLIATGQTSYEGLITSSDTLLENYTQRVPSSLRNSQFDNTLEVYLEAATETNALVASIDGNNAQFSDSYADALVTASRISNLIDEHSEAQFTLVDQAQINARLVLLGGIALVLLVGGGVTYLFANDLTGRLGALLRTTQEFETGNLEIRANLRGEDEFSQLAHSFNAMAVQLQGLVGGLEQRVAERTRDLTITAEIGQAVVALRDPLTLMNEVVELIRQRFGFYHAQVFMVDDLGEQANLVASTGTAGRELLARRHTLEVGSLSVIGQVTSTGEPVIAVDTGQSQVHRRNELLPDTRSEMALPMRIGDRIIGALDVQSVAPNAFDEDSVAVFQIMADQLAIALENARQYNELLQTRSMLDAIEKQLTGDAWDTYRLERGRSMSLGYVMDGDNIEAVDVAAHPALNQAMRDGQVISVEQNGSEGVNLAIPIRVRGEVIGAFGFVGEQLHDLSEEDMTLIEAVVDRVGLALENLRLVEQTTRRAEYEQLVNEITAKIVGSTDVSHILQTTVRELGRVLQAPQTSVQLRSLSGDDE